MKLAVLLTMVAILNATAGSYAQYITIKERGITLSKAMEKVHEQSGYEVFFSVKEQAKVRLNVNLVNASLEEAMELLLGDLPLQWKLKDNIIIIQSVTRNNRPPRLEVNQQRTIEGRVTDEDGKPLEGVTVIVKESPAATKTNTDGRYRLQVPEDGMILAFTIIGFEPTERTIGHANRVDVAMKAMVSDLDEVVVVGYGTQRRRDLTGAISSVNAKQIKDTPTPSLDGALTARMPGVQVSQTTGAPGGGISVKVRGTGSIGAGNEPLYVIDGFPITANYNQESNPLNSINTNDIESIEVLKDASATAIYGSRGSNGVIIVTTKSGMAGKMKVDLDMFTGFQQTTKYMDVMNAQEYASYIIDSRNNAWIDTGGDPSAPNSERGAIYQILPVLQDPEALAHNTNWQRELFRTAPTHNLQLTFSGGNDRINYMTSAGYYKQDGIIINSDFSRYAFRVNLEAKASDKFRVGLNLSPSYSVRNPVSAEGHFSGGAVVLTAVMMPPVMPVHNEDGGYNTAIGLGNGFSSLENPVKVALEREHNNTDFRLLGTAFAEYAFLDNLKYKLLVGTDLQNEKNNTFNPSTVGSDGNPPPVIPNATYNSQASYNWLIEHTLNYTNDFGKHRVDVLGGFTAQKVRADMASIAATNFPNDLVRTLNAGVVSSASTSALEWSLLSLLGRVNYSYNDKYLLTATIRQDGSSRFGANRKWGVFPSVSGGWRISQESFMQGIEVINELKLRASFGYTGNNFIGNYDHIGRLSIANYVFGSNGGNLVNAISPSSIGNDELGWERNKQFDVGLEVGLWNGRLSLTTDYYHKITSDLLLDVPVPSLTGYTSARQNIGRVRNQGWEFGVSSRNFTGAFSWNTDLNFSLNRNAVLELGPSGEPIFGNYQLSNSHITAIGKPLGSFYGYNVAGIFQTPQEVAQYPSFSNSAPGQFRFEDVNGDGQLSVDDRTILGNTQPDFIYGVTNNFAYKGFELSFLIQGVHGNEIMNLGRRFYANFAGTANALRELNNRWRSAEDPGDGKTPRVNRDLSRYSTSNASANISSTHIEDGSFVRLKSISFGYNVPTASANRWHLASVRIYMNVQNLLTISDYSGYNPEASIRGIDPLTPGVDYGGYPIAKVFTFGLNVGF
ncbi:SusC/RagA family TonB-linked outer membrane protein [Parapedobacter tibetensis]|uniref:SusC/RagA family TonB-linked outer membrane protein n=1 Tax=Parapedobacter tibetensis TaxID=2972951 RepID=UPI00214D7BEF|nr:TonB-dependent receptor [Parapedobacter tibetensis]